MRALITSRIVPRTTLDLDPGVLRDLKRRGDRERKSMGQIASELLAKALAEDDSAAVPRSFRWKTGDLGKPRVDLEDKEAVRRVLDEHS
jgi:hypothetical protein